MSEVIEDTLTRQRKMQENFRRKADRCRKEGKPQELIDHYEELSKMSMWEYEAYEREQREIKEKLHRDAVAEYAKNNPIKKEIVDKIYETVEDLEYSNQAYVHPIVFCMKLKLLDYMSQEDYNYDLYDAFISHAREIYRKKYEKEYREEM